MSEINENSKAVDPDSKEGDFLQSVQWREFQEKVGRKTLYIENDGFLASVIEHTLPIVGKYLYIPRGPIMEHGVWNMDQKSGMRELIDLAKKKNAGWIRVDLENNEILDTIKKNITEKIVKAPHDMQPREVFVIDIAKSAEQLLAEMKPKTRYNIGMAQKKGVRIFSCSKNEMECMRTELDFFRLTKEMAARQGIVSHPEAYYRKMIESLPPDMLKIYAAEYDGKIIATNLVLFYGDTAIYLHGASGNLHRNLMAPFSLQWQAILDAKEKGCARYDFGGVKTHDTGHAAGNGWEGITTFKMGFSTKTKPI
jgi:lipid II:glycine glycyltransferase (peptidoglycan interpeptide bridge formation enzyme)